MFEPGTSILVTGGSGFIGGRLIDHLLNANGLRITSIDKQGYASDVERTTRQVERGLTAIHADISDADTVWQTIQLSSPDCVFHLAAESHVDRSIDGPDNFIRSNIDGTFTLLEATRRLGKEAAKDVRFVHVSTDEVFGSAEPEAWFTLDTPYDPRSPYSASKAASDHLARAWAHTYDMDVIVTNCTNNFGPFQYPEKLIPHMIIRALSGKSLPVYGDGRQIRDWLHVDDHVTALMLAAQRGTSRSTYLIGGRNPTTNLDLVERICSSLDDLAPGPTSYAEQIDFVTDRPGHDRRYAIDPSSAEVGLGWSAERTLNEALAETVQWYLDNREWWERVLDRGYAAERIGVKHD